MSGRTRIGELGEAGLIARIVERIGPAPGDETWSGDDAAVISTSGPRQLITTDFIVEDVDFTLAGFPPDAIGWKAMAVNASDVAAMGGTPEHAVVSISLRADLRLEEVDGILDGVLAAAATWDIAVVGGDISRAREVMVSVTLLGSIDSGAVVYRSGAGAGEAICVTGSLGGAAGGLLQQRKGHREVSEPGGLVERQLYPRARVEEGRQLAAGGATSMIDISDGLAVDLARLMEASGTGCRVDLDALPVDPGLDALRTLLGRDFDPLELAVTGGEDFELLFTIDQARFDEVRARVAELGTEVTRIGVVSEGERRLGDRSLDEWKDKGWDHLRDP